MKGAAMKPIAIFVVLLFCVNIATPQEQDGAKPDRWRGLILDESTTEDAIKLLGQPKKDGLGNLYVSDIENWLSRKYWSTHNGKAFRNLDYEKPSENINRVLLSFLDNKLVGINIYPKNVKGAPTKESLPVIYGIPFEPVQSGTPFFQPGADPHKVLRYPECGIGCLWGIVAVTKTSFVVGGMVGNRLFSITLVSRTLQSKDGSDVLK
jgi:hypothetical protein